MSVEEVLINLSPALAGVARSIFGWAENAFQDSKITAIELSQLGATIVRVGMISIGLQYGIGLEPISASASAIVADFILSAIKKMGNKKIETPKKK